MNPQMFNSAFDNVLPAGTYFIGDICNFLQDAFIENAWTNSDGCFVGTDGTSFAVTKPRSGNGLYTGSNKFTYDIETNAIGVIPTTLGDQSKFTGCGTFHKFNDAVSVSLSPDGIFTVKSGDWRLVIDTNDCESVNSDDTGYDSWS